MGGVEFYFTGGALLLSAGVCEILIELEEKFPEGGVAEQILVHVLNIQVVTKFTKYTTPRRPYSSDQARRGEIS